MRSAKLFIKNQVMCFVLIAMSVPFQAQARGVEGYTKALYFEGKVNEFVVLNLVNRLNYHERSTLDEIKSHLLQTLNGNLEALKEARKSNFKHYSRSSSFYPDSKFKSAQAAIANL